MRKNLTYTTNKNKMPIGKCHHVDVNFYLTVIQHVVDGYSGWSSQKHCTQHLFILCMK